MNATNVCTRGFRTSSVDLKIFLLSRLRVVDNSPIGKQAMLEGKPPKVIHVYSKMRHGLLGDKVMVAIKGQKKKGFLVGLTARQQTMLPQFDSNNVVLVDDNNNPLGTRVLAPLPNYLRSKGTHMSKIMAIATKFV